MEFEEVEAAEDEYVAKNPSVKAYFTLMAGVKKTNGAGEAKDKMHPFFTERGLSIATTF